MFLSPSEPRLRAFWRLLIQSLLLFFFLLFFTFIILIAYYLVFRMGLSAFGTVLASEISELLAITLSVFLARRFLDKRSFVSLGFKWDGRAIGDLLVGLAISFMMMGSIYWSMTALGWIHFQGFLWQSEPPWTVIAGSLLIFFAFILTGWNEELLCRGYQLQTIASGSNIFLGVVVSSIIFGVLHLTNPNATWTAALGIFFAGIFLAFAYVRTGRLWLSIGLHLGWNFFEGPAFGFSVSGVDFIHLTHITISGPVAWTGGSFGPEAGLIILPAIALGSILIQIYAITRNRHPFPADAKGL